MTPREDRSDAERQSIAPDLLSPEFYRRKAEECLALSYQLTDPKSRWRFSSLRIGGCAWQKITGRRDTHKALNQRWYIVLEIESSTAARTAIDGCSLVNLNQGAFLSDTFPMCPLAGKRPILKLAHSLVSEAMGLSTLSCCV